MTDKLSFWEWLIVLALLPFVLALPGFLFDGYLAHLP